MREVVIGNKKQERPRRSLLHACRPGAGKIRYALRLGTAKDSLDNGNTSILFDRMGIPLFRCFTEPYGFKHSLALRIERIDVCLYFFHSFFLGERKHIYNTSAPNLAVLISFANDDADLCILPQRHISHKLPAIPDIITIPVRAKISIHAIQQIQIIRMIQVVNLLANIKVLIPSKRNLGIWIIRNKDDLLIYDSILHGKRQNVLIGSKDSSAKSAGKRTVQKREAFRRKTPPS